VVGRRLIRGSFEDCFGAGGVGDSDGCPGVGELDDGRWLNGDLHRAWHPLHPGHPATVPDCGHTYLQPSIGQPGDRYPVTVTARWQISWAGAGRAGVLPDLQRTATTSFRVAEVQTVNS